MRGFHHVNHAFVAAVEVPNIVPASPVEDFYSFDFIIEEIVVGQSVLRVENASDDAFYLGEKNDT